MSAKELRTSRERTLFGISAVFSTVVWLALIVSVVGALYGVFIALFVLIAHCLLLAHLIGNGVRIGPRQLPDLHARIEAAAAKLGLGAAPEAYIVQSGGLLNAFATKILSRRFIIIYSDLVEACEGDGTARGPNELDFVIGHELGHVAAGHLAFQFFLLPARILPLVGPAYSRACEYTCDRCGHEVVADLTVSSRALAILAAGPRTARRMDLDAFVDQRQDTRRFWMAVYELNATHPFLSKRVAALRHWRQQGAAAPVGRNPWAYPLAPFFGVLAGNAAPAVGMLVIVMVVAAAIAVPMVKQRMAGLSALTGLAGVGAHQRIPGLDDSAAEATDPETEANMARLRKILEDAAKQQEQAPDPGPR
jgi:Zn-dependent protease with chaperone function